MSFFVRLTLLLACVIAAGAAVEDHLRRELVTARFASVEASLAAEQARRAPSDPAPAGREPGRDGAPIAGSESLRAAVDATLRAERALSAGLALGLLLVLAAALRVVVLRPLARSSEALSARLAEAQRQVHDTARAAGMTEVALGILHNVGNVLNGINLSASVLGEQVAELCVDDLEELAAALRERAGDPTRSPVEERAAGHLPTRLAALVEQLRRDRDELAREALALSSGIEHVCELVRSQQGLARSTGIRRRVTVAGLVEDALRMTERTRGGSGPCVDVELEQDLPALQLDRNRALEVLVNLVQNARQAIEAAPPRPEGHALRVRARRAAGDKLRIDVRDSGVGIAAEDLARVFRLGFTTKVTGSGLGLHSALEGARELGGGLEAASEGAGRGACFTLELPLQDVGAAPGVRAAA